MSAWVIETQGFASNTYLKKDGGETTNLSEATIFHSLETLTTAEQQISETYPNASGHWIP